MGNMAELSADACGTLNTWRIRFSGGGLLREFLGELMRTAFDPNRGLFRCSHDRRLYPNPAVGQLPDYGTQAARHYTFVGRMLAKALYEGMLVELPLAHFFLAKLVSAGRGDLDLHHLASLEPLVYRNLLFLKARGTFHLVAANKC